MCGRFQLRPDGEIVSLMDKLGAVGELRPATDIAPGARISIIHGGEAGRVVDTALWWLLLDAKTLQPNYQYPSFNSRSDKLAEPRSIAYKPFRESRCIIPASAFCEGLGDKKTYHMIEQVGRAIAFGGLYRQHRHADTGELVYSASIITLPPVAKWSRIHPKSLPLMLDVDDGEMIKRWLDPACRDTSVFATLLEPVLRHPQRVTPIGKPSLWNPTGPSFIIEP